MTTLLPIIGTAAPRSLLKQIEMHIAAAEAAGQKVDLVGCVVVENRPEDGNGATYMPFVSVHPVERTLWAAEKLKRHVFAVMEEHG